MTVSSRWILNPILDILFCCGGLVWILYFAQDILLASINPQLTESTALLAIAGSHLFGEAHICATLFRIYGSREMRNNFKLCTIWQPLVGLLLCIAGLFFPPVTAAMLKVYLLWVFQHFTGQAYGLILLYCFKHNYQIGNYEKKLLSFLLNCTAAVAITRQLALDDWAIINYLGLDLPNWGRLPLPIYQLSVILLQAAVCLFIIQICKRAFLERSCFPLPSLLILFTVVLTFTANVDVSSKLWLYLPAFFHASQYLAITATQYFKEQNFTGANSSSSWKLLIGPAGLQRYSHLLLSAVALYVGIPTILSFCGFSKELAFASIFCVVNLHHFMTDMVIWKMRNPRTRKALV